ncbi:MAG: hypothetical protein ABIJ00_12060 [Candidatus Eisenbacteria bacterium]
MAVELKKISLEGHYLDCRFEGEFGNLAKMIENTLRILKAYRETKCPNALLDFSEISGRIDVFGEHRLALHIARVIPPGTKIAVLAPPHMKDAASGHLENAAVNRAAQLRVFWEREESVKWLRAS